MAAEVVAIKKSKILGLVLAKTSDVSNFTGIKRVMKALAKITKKILKNKFLKDFQVLFF